MPPVPGSSYGRTAVLIALGVLAVTVGATAYLFLAQGHTQALNVGTRPGPDAGQPADGLAENRRALTFLIMVSISALLILMFVLGAYLVIRVGHFLARERVGGKPTPYVDAWGSYRLTDEQIAAATAEGKPGGPPAEDEPPEASPPPSPPAEPPSGS
jgi:hypothetical protein